MQHERYDLVLIKVVSAQGASRLRRVACFVFFCTRSLAGFMRRQIGAVYAAPVGWFPRTRLSDASFTIKAKNRAQ